MKEKDLLENETLRNKLIERTDILDKVKTLLLIPDTNHATAQQVSEFYEVGLEAIKGIIFNHSEELLLDGMKNLTCKETKEFLGSCNKQLANFRGYFTCEGIKLSNRNNLFFSRRAILRVGMLLRDSEIAKEVRTQLLNIEEKTSDKTKTQDIDNEQKLMLEIGMAVASGNATAVAIASSNLVAFKNRHIDKLKTDNIALAKGNLEWEDRSKINFAIRKLAKVSEVKIPDLWNDLYQQLLYKHHIDVKRRGKQPWIQHVKESEWNAVIKTFSSMCMAYGTTPTDIFTQLKMSEVY